MSQSPVVVSLVLLLAGVGCGLRSQPMAPEGGTSTSGSGGSVSGGGGTTMGPGSPGAPHPDAGSVGGASEPATGAGGGAGTGGAAGMSQMPSDGGPSGGSGGSGGGMAGSTCTAGKACLPTNLCHVGQSACSAAGVASCTDTNAAQPNGTMCGVVEGGASMCTNGACGFTCNNGRLKCSGAMFCQTPSWSFEDGTTGGFALSGKDPMAATAVSVSKAFAHTGSYSLAITVKAQGSKRNFEVAIPICGGGTGFAAGTGQMATAWFFVVPDANSIERPPATSAFGQHLTTSAGDAAMLSINSTVVTWFQITTPITNIGSQITKLAIDGLFGPAGDSASYDWTGTIYVDDIAFQ